MGGATGPVTHGWNMTKRLQAKFKLDRRLGKNLWGRSKSPVNRRAYGPGQHGQRRKSKVSDYGTQLLAKQQLRFYYGNITEKQFRRIYAEADRRKGNTAENLIGLLECRLDAMVYRSKLAPTPFAARQLVNHGHVKVNGRRVNIPSFLVRVDDLVELRDKAKNMALVLEAMDSKERDVPDYIAMDKATASAKLTRVPTLSDVPYPVHMQPNLVVEYYSS
jgi:small subunit ribosomal protein S4